ncbi:MULTISPECIES: SMP-30/gluconolactonase/LRE family protein [unclassified Luteimonas]
MRLLPSLLTAALALGLAACTAGGDDSASANTDADAAAAEPPTAASFETVGQLTTYDAAFADVADADARVEKLTGDEFTWSEGPTWVRDGGGYLLFNDVPENRMYRWSQADGLSVFLDPSGYAGPPLDTLREGGANGLFTEADGSVLLADSGNRLIARFNASDKSRTTLAESFEGKRFNSPNDVIARGDGTVFFTDPPYGLKDGDDSPAKEQKVNGIYRIDADGSVHLLDDSLNRPNGIAFSPDGNTLYVANSDDKRPIWMAYTLDATGNVVDKRQFADASDLVGDDAPGLPDGLAVSTEGLVFATGPGGVLVFAADGTRLGRIETGSAVANAAFGDDGRTLYMTSHKFLARVPLKVTGLGFQD